MTTYISPFDFQKIFVDTFAGGWLIFFFLITIALSILAAKFRMNDKIFLISIVLFGILMAPQIGGLYVLIIVILGLSIYHGISKVVKG